MANFTYHPSTETINKHVTFKTKYGGLKRFCECGAKIDAKYEKCFKCWNKPSDEGYASQKDYEEGQGII